MWYVGATCGRPFLLVPHKFDTISVAVSGRADNIHPYGLFTTRNKKEIRFNKMADIIARPLPSYGRPNRGTIAEQPEIQNKNSERVRKKPKQVGGIHRLFRRLRLILGFAILIGLLMLVMNSNAELVTQQGEFDKLSAQIIELQSELDYLNFQLEQRSSLEKVESFATRELGLIKSDNSSTTYIRLNQENVLEVNETQLSSWQKLLSQNFLSIVEYLNP